MHNPSMTDKDHGVGAMLSATASTRSMPQRASAPGVPCGHVTPHELRSAVSASYADPSLGLPSSSNKGEKCAILYLDEFHWGNGRTVMRTNFPVEHLISAKIGQAQQYFYIAGTHKIVFPYGLAPFRPFQGQGLVLTFQDAKRVHTLTIDSFDAPYWPTEESAKPKRARSTRKSLGMGATLRAAKSTRSLKPARVKKPFVAGQLYRSSQSFTGWMMRWAPKPGGPGEVGPVRVSNVANGRGQVTEVYGLLASYPSAIVNKWWPIRHQAGMAGMGAPSYAQRMFGNEFSVDLRRVGDGHFRATVNAQGNSYANRVFGDHFQVDGQSGDDYYRGVLSTKTLGMGRRRTRGTLKGVR